MSQQKIVVALCLFGAVALASAQMNFDLNRCTENVRTEVDRYRETLLESSQKFTQNLQSAGSSAMDTSRFQNDINKLINSMSSLTNMENGFDLNRITSTYMENIQTMASLMRNSFQMSLVSGTMENYIEMFNSVYGANTSFMSKVTSACMPNRRFGRV